MVDGDPKIGDPIEPAAPPVRQSVQFYTHTNARHGVHPETPAGPSYENPEVADLYRRLREKFKEMGHDF